LVMDPLCACLFAKIAEQIDHTDRLLSLLPPAAAGWRPPVPPGTRALWSVGELAPHLLECMTGFLAVLLRLRPRELARLEQYRGLPAPGTIGALRDRIRTLRGEIESGFALLAAADLPERVPTVFVPAGEPALTLLLGNLEHLINHKHQLFLYLRLMGFPAATPDLYRLRA